MQATWLVLLPPCIVLLSAFITKRLNFSLMLGILVGAFIAADFSIALMIKTSIDRLAQTVSDIDNLQMYAFLFMLSILVVLLNRTGGANAFARALTTRLRSGRMAETSSILLSSALFIDDYLSGLTVGYVMRPITDQFKIPRTKLAYLVHSLTGPLVILAPISSWVAAITSTLDQAGVAPAGHEGSKIIGDPFFVYLETIPYIFYSLLTIASVWFIVRMRLSFGPMHTHEKIAQDTGNLFGGKEAIAERFEADATKVGSLADLLVPLFTLICSVFAGSLWVGDFYLFGGTRGLLDAFKHNNKIFLVLFVSGIISLLVSFMFALVRRRITMQEIPTIVMDGIQLMKNAVLMVILASTLGKILRIDLLTGEYLSATLHGSLAIEFLPFIFFVVSTITAMLTGSSWGTMMLLIPLAIPMLTSLAHIPLPATPEMIPLFFPVLGAIFSGSVCGDHLSPISETTIMAATSSGAYPLAHAQTQFPYAIPAIVSSGFCFLLTGFLANYSFALRFIVPLTSSILLCFGLLLLMNRMPKKSNNSTK